MTIDIAINELRKFSENLLELNDPLSEAEIRKFELEHQLRLPADYKFMLQQFDGATLDGTEIYGIMPANGSYPLRDCYHFEHHLVENEMPDYLVPFSPDGGGNHYCFDTRNNSQESCAIVFWQHDYPYSNDDPPEQTHHSFADWIKQVMIDWTLEDYDYDGTEK